MQQRKGKEEKQKMMLGKGAGHGLLAAQTSCADCSWGFCVKCRCRRSRCGAGLRLSLSSRLPVMRMLLAGDHSSSGRPVPAFQLQSFYSESIGIANGLSVKKGLDEMSASKFPSGSGCTRGIWTRGASMTLEESRTVVITRCSGWRHRVIRTHAPPQSPQWFGFQVISLVPPGNHPRVTILGDLFRAQVHPTLWASPWKIKLRDVLRAHPQCSQWYVMYSHRADNLTQVSMAHWKITL